MKGTRILVVVAGLAALVVSSAVRAEEAKAPEEPTDEIMGEYAGKCWIGDVKSDAEAKVIAEGDGNYRAVLLPKVGGEDAKGMRIELTGKAEGKRVALAGKVGDTEWKGTIEGGERLVAECKDGEFDLKFAVRKSPTLGQKPPAGAVVLLPFKEGEPPSLDAWENRQWVALPDGSVLVKGGNNHTKQSFGNVRLHLEFRTPLMPTARGQGRGNSGVYLQSRYEVQVLDSFGLVPRDNECGGIYSVGAPTTNASLPPGQWQTYDITFTAPEVADGKMTKPALVTVLFNGVKIHENVKVDHTTTAGDGGPPMAKAPLMLQDHGNPVRYRNIWIIETGD